MPKGYMKMKKAMVKEYGAKRGEKIAAMTWNKKHKGTGETVGKGRRADEMAGEMVMGKKKKGKRR